MSSAPTGLPPAAALWSRTGVVLLAAALVELVWIILVAAPTRPSGGWLAGLAVESMPLAVLYLAALLSGRYSARALPLDSPGLRRLVVAHGLAALTLAALWVGLARGWAALLRGAAFPQAAPRLEQNSAPLVLFAATGYLLAVAVHYLVEAAETSRAAAVRSAQAATLARESELRALRAQVSPHFLFNSLNSVAALVKADPEAARDLCGRLAEFLRQTLRLGGGPSVSLAEELELARHLVAIEQTRFGARLRWCEEISEDVEVRQKTLRVPPLLLLPLLENAMTHGVAQRLEASAVLLGLTLRQGRLLLTVENDLDGGNADRTGAGVGLVNVRQRLEKLYGSAASIDTERCAGRFRVRIAIPQDSE